MLIRHSYSHERIANKLSIPSLLNEESIDPMQHIHSPKHNQLHEWNDISPSQHYYHSLMKSPCSSPTTPPDLWSHSKTGTHQTDNGHVIVSALSKAKRKRILPYQYERLVKTFNTTDTPSSEIRAQLAEELCMTKREVQVWFQNRRAKINRNKHRETLHKEEPIPRPLSSQHPIKWIAPKTSAHENVLPIDLLASAAEMMRFKY